MKSIEALDTAIENRELVPGTNNTFLWAYRDSKEADSDLLNFGDVIWDIDIEPILADCKKYGISEFTISCNFCGLLSTVEKFTEYGCKLDGLVKAKSRHRNFITGEQETNPALKISL